MEMAAADELGAGMAGDVKKTSSNTLSPIGEQRYSSCRSRFLRFGDSVRRQNWSKDGLTKGHHSTAADGGRHWTRRLLEHSHGTAAIAGSDGIRPKEDQGEKEANAKEKRDWLGGTQLQQMWPSPPPMSLSSAGPMAASARDVSMRSTTRGGAQDVKARPLDDQSR